MGQQNAVCFLFSSRCWYLKIMRIVLKPQQCLDHDDEEPPNCNKSTRFNPNYDLSLYNNASLGMDIGISCCV